MDVATELTWRKGPRPQTTATFPHSQVDQQPDDPGLLVGLAHRAFALPGVVERPSCVSVPGARALVLANDLIVGPTTAFIAQREFAHFHPGPDWSLHVALPDATADLAIERGWAELHLIARTEELPGSVVLLYAPRDHDEVDALWALLQASHEYAAGGS